jgi:hypothetical protein
MSVIPSEEPGFALAVLAQPERPPLNITAVFLVRVVQVPGRNQGSFRMMRRVNAKDVLGIRGEAFHITHSFP